MDCPRRVWLSFNWCNGSAFPPQNDKQSHTCERAGSCIHSSDKTRQIPVSLLRFHVYTYRGIARQCPPCLCKQNNKFSSMSRFQCNLLFLS